MAWAGYSAAASTWEPRVNVGLELIAEYEERLRLEAEEEAEAEAELEDEEDEDVADGTADADDADADAADAVNADADAADADADDADADADIDMGADDGAGEGGEGLQLLVVSRIWKHHVYGGARAGSLYNVYVGVEWSDGSRTVGGVEPSEPLAGSESGRAALLAYVATAKGKAVAKYLPFS